MNASHSTYLFTNSCSHISTNGKAHLHSLLNHNNPQFLYSLWRRANARNVNFLNLSRWLSNPHLTCLIKPNFCLDLSHRRSTTVSLETRNSKLYDDYFTVSSMYMWGKIPSYVLSPSPNQAFIWILGCITWARLLGTEKDNHHEVEWNGSGRRPRAGLINKVIK